MRTKKKGEIELGVHVHEPTHSVLLNVEDPFAIRDLISESYTIEHPLYNTVVRHTAEVTRILRNLGFEVPTPAFGTYQWPGKYKPMDHQIEMVKFHTTHPRGFNLSEMGTCKTAAALWAADILMLEGTIKRVAIIAPLSTLERVWAQDIFDVLMHRVCAVVHGTRERRRKAMSVDAHFYLINHDGISIEELWRTLRKRTDIGLIIVDEGAMFRNPGTDKYKALTNLLRPDQQVWWLTGTPCPNAPTDAWAQARIINPHGVPQFAGTFKRQTMYKVSQFKWVPRPDADRLAFAALQPAIRFLKKDCLDLPPVVPVSLQATLSVEQRNAFKAMKVFMTAELASKQITAVNAADRIGKCRQILCGAVKDPKTDKYVTIPHAPRLAVLREAIEMASAKVLVIVPFKGIIQALEHELMHPSDRKQRAYTVGVLNGDVSIPARNKIIVNFKTTPHPEILLCHPKVMAHGLNLTEADTTIFYAPIYSNDEFTQVIERMNRAGQTRKMTVVRIGAHPLEWEIYRQVDIRAISQDNILKLYASVVNDLT